MPELWVVVYRAGGTDNHRWERSLAFADRGDAIRAMLDVVAGGRPAFVQSLAESLRYGLPENFLPGRWMN